jgi:hypothetical protein
VHFFIVWHFVPGGAAGRVEPGGQFLVAQGFRASPAQLLRNCPLQRGDHRLSGYTHAFGDLTVVDPQAAQPKDLSVVGHIS